MNESRRKELYKLALDYSQLTVLEEDYVKSLIKTTKKSYSRIAVDQAKMDIDI